MPDDESNLILRSKYKQTLKYPLFNVCELKKLYIWERRILILIIE